MVTKVVQKIDISLTPSTERRLREALSDAYAFVRSVESNRAFATVTLEQLINDQIRRNGDTKTSNASQYNPYSLDQDAPASEEPATRANFLGAADTGRPTKLDFVLALKEEIGNVVESVKNTEVVDVAEAEEYTDAVEVGFSEEDGA